LAVPATRPRVEAERVEAHSRYGRVHVRAWGGLHPELERRAAWADHAGPLPIIEGSIINLTVDHLPGDRAPKPVWLWCSDPDPAGADLDRWWRSYLRRFDIEHTFRTPPPRRQETPQKGQTPPRWEATYRLKIKLSRREDRREDYLTLLTNIRAVRDALDELADRYAYRAKQNGADFAEIDAATGVSRQAARQRHMRQTVLRPVTMIGGPWEGRPMNVLLGESAVRLLAFDPWLKSDRQLIVSGVVGWWAWLASGRGCEPG
jgi:hypothetical protein